MTPRPDADGSTTRTSHSLELGEAYEQVLAGTSVRSRQIEVGVGKRVHLLEIGTGPPVVLLHGGGGTAGFFVPLLNELNGVRALAPDRPGQGLSDPIDLPRDRYRETAVAWLDGLFDALGLDAAALLGHSGGAMWALWYALARPDRVMRLVLIAPPAVPRTRCPLPLRLIATPGVGALLSRLVPPTPKSVARFASAMGERATVTTYPDLIDLWVASLRDPIADRVGRAEERFFISPFALLSPSGLRRHARVGAEELGQVAMPALVIWGEREPLGGVSVAQAVTELMPDARLQMLGGGHAPWLGQPAEAAAAIVDLLR
jgi:2-hydroxy-6-oxonona-2,4-dienedioate hydrolase